MRSRIFSFLGISSGKPATNLFSFLDPVWLSQALHGPEHYKVKERLVFFCKASLPTEHKEAQGAAAAEPAAEEAIERWGPDAVRHNYELAMSLLEANKLQQIQVDRLVPFTFFFTSDEKRQIERLVSEMWRRQPTLLTSPTPAVVPAEAAAEGEGPTGDGA